MKRPFSGLETRNLAPFLAWATLLTWTAILAATDWLFGACVSECSDSGGLLVLLLLTLLAPPSAVGASYLVRSGRSDRSRRALALLAIVCAALVACLVIIFVGV